MLTKILAWGQRCGVLYVLRNQTYSLFVVLLIDHEVISLVEKFVQLCLYVATLCIVGIPWGVCRSFNLAHTFLSFLCEKTI